MIVLRRSGSTLSTHLGSNDTIWLEEGDSASSFEHILDRHANSDESTRGRGSYNGDKPPVFIIADHGTGQRYVIPAKAADESTIRLLLAVGQQESLTVYTDSFRAYEPLEDDDAFDREYADDEVHVNACESHASRVRRWLSPYRGISKDKLTQYLRAFQLRRELFRKPDRDALKHAVRATL